METTPDHNPSDAFFGELDARLAETHDAVLLSQDRCVDALLDLYNATGSPTIRRVIQDSIVDIRDRSALPGARLRSVLRLLFAAASVEATFADDVQLEAA